VFRGWAEGLIPLRADAAQEGRIDDQLPEGVNQGHVDRREAADAAHINAKIEAVRICSFHKGAQRCGMRSPVDQLKELLILEAVDDAEESLACARQREGPGAIVGCQARCESLPGACSRFTIPTKEPADEETHAHQRAHARRKRERTPGCRPYELIQRDARARPRQINRPHIMKRHTREKVVNPQWQPFELFCRDLRHRASFAALLLFDLSRITDKPKAPDGSSTTSGLPTIRSLAVEAAPGLAMMR